MTERQKGFTLLEALFSVGLIAILAGMSLPLYLSFQNRNDLDIAAQGIASALRRAQVYARGVSGDDQWGVKIQAGSATLFKGPSYALRDDSYSETSPISSGLTLGGALNEVVFSKVSAAPSANCSLPCAVTLTAQTNDVKTVTINDQGMVSY